MTQYRTVEEELQSENGKNGFFTPETKCRVYIDDVELKTKHRDRQRALVLVVCCGALPAVLWRNASALGSTAVHPLYHGLGYCNLSSMAAYEIVKVFPVTDPKASYFNPPCNVIYQMSSTCRNQVDYTGQATAHQAMQAIQYIYNTIQCIY